MKLDSGKKNRCDRMMCLKSFETQEVRERDRPEGSRRVKRLFHVIDGKNKRCLPDGRKIM